MKPGPVALVLALSALTLAGCSSPAVSIATESHAGTPDGFDSTSNLLNGRPGAAWIGGRDAFAIVTYGSTNCAPIPTKLEATDESTILVTFVKAENGGCSASRGATTNEFDVPDGIVDDGPVTIDVLFDFGQDYEYSVTLR